MHSYQELALDVAPEYQALKDSAHRFAKEVLRPTSIELDRSPIRAMSLRSTRPCGGFSNKATNSATTSRVCRCELGGLGLSGLGTHILIEELVVGRGRSRAQPLVRQFSLLRRGGERESAALTKNS